MGILIDKIKTELEKSDGSMGIKEFRRKVGVNYKISRKEFRRLVKEMQRSKSFKITKSKISLKGMKP